MCIQCLFKTIHLEFVCLARWPLGVFRVNRTKSFFFRKKAFYPRALSSANKKMNINYHEQETFCEKSLFGYKNAWEHSPTEMPAFISRSQEILTFRYQNSRNLQLSSINPSPDARNINFVFKKRSSPPGTQISPKLKIIDGIFYLVDFS